MMDKYNVIFKEITGSRLFKIEDYKDTDYFIICANLPRECNGYTYDTYNGTDYFCYELDFRKKMVEGVIFNKNSIYLAQDIICKERLDYPIDFDYLKLEKPFKENMRNYIEDVKIQKPKHLYWVYIIFKMWENKSTRIEPDYIRVIKECKKRNFTRCIEYIDKEMEVVHNDK